MKLYSFFRSSAAYRVRIALHLKGIAFDTMPVHLNRDGGEQHKPAYRGVNPQGRVPALELDDGTVLTQSLAIIDYLEVTHPKPPIYPRDPVERAKALAVALTIVADTHPITNMSMMNYVGDWMRDDAAEPDRWYAHWIGEGFRTVEQLIEGDRFCFGDMPTVADACLVPQVFNARRLKVDLSPFPKIVKVDAAASALPAFAKAHPNVQPDAE